MRLLPRWESMLAFVVDDFGEASNIGAGWGIDRDKEERRVRRGVVFVWISWLPLAEK